MHRKQLHSLINTMYAGNKMLLYKKKITRKLLLELSVWRGAKQCSSFTNVSIYTCSVLERLCHFAQAIIKGGLYCMMSGEHSCSNVFLCLITCTGSCLDFSVSDSRTMIGKCFATFMHKSYQ